MKTFYRVQFFLKINHSDSCVKLILHIPSFYKLCRFSFYRFPHLVFYLIGGLGFLNEKASHGPIVKVDDIYIYIIYVYNICIYMHICIVLKKLCMYIYIYIYVLESNLKSQHCMVECCLTSGGGFAGPMFFARSIMLTAECAGAPNFVLINYLTRSNGKRDLE